MKRAALTALACAFASPALAEPGGTSSVSGPEVTAGETSLEARTAAYEGGALDGNWAYRMQAEHAFTDSFQAALILRGSQPNDESAEFDSIALETRFEFEATEHWRVRLGVQGQYKLGVHGNDDELEFKLLAQHDGEGWEARANYIVERALNDDAEWESGYAAHLMWDVSDAVALGFEAFGELDADAHAAGPRLTYKMNQVELGLGYLAGLGDAQSDQQFRVRIAWSP